ncbi:MAG: hypothetical protein AAB403_00655 [Planctomycetota bacterium]
MQELRGVVSVIRVSDGEKPQMGPTPAKSILIEVQTSAGPGFLEISQSGALDLVAKLSQHLKERGSV